MMNNYPRYFLETCGNCRWFESYYWLYGICRKFRIAYASNTAEGFLAENEGNYSLVHAWRRGCPEWEEGVTNGD